MIFCSGYGAISSLPCKKRLYPLFCKINYMKKIMFILKIIKREEVDIAASCMAVTICEGAIFEEWLYMREFPDGGLYAYIIFAV